MTLRLIIPLLILFYFLIGLPYYSGDIKNHLAWAEGLVKIGPMNFYNIDFNPFAFPNYPPLAMALFGLSLVSYNLTDSTINILNNIPFFPSNIVQWFKWENVLINFLKLPAILSTVGLGVVLYHFIGLIKPNFSNRARLLLVLIFTLNPAVIYLSAIWGQIDLLPVFFVLLGFYLINRKLYLSALFMTLAVLSKQTSIVFYGIYFLLLVKLYGWAKALKVLLITLGIFLLSYMPFMGWSLDEPFALFRKNFNLVAFSTSENAFNLWGLLGHYERFSDLEKFLFLNFQQWGYLLFLIFTLPIVVLLLNKSFSYYKLFYFLFLLSGLYFFFLTRMHERYIIPIIVFLSILVVLKRKFILGLIFFTILSLVNIYRGLYEPDWQLFKDIANFLPFLNILVFAYGGFLAYYYLDFIKEKNHE